jgi:hypothetical protein
MIQRVTHLDVHRTALILALCGAVVTLPFVLVSVPVFLLAPSGSSGGSGLGVAGGLAMVVLTPVLYFVFGYLVTALGVVVFNAIAPRLGGVPVTVEVEV